MRVCIFVYVSSYVMFVCVCVFVCVLCGRELCAVVWCDYPPTSLAAHAGLED